MLTAAEVSAAAQQVSDDPVGYIGVCVFIAFVAWLVWLVIR